MAGDPVEEKAVRTFLAVPLAEFFLPELQSGISQMQKRMGGVKWVLPSQVHITLHFFGKTDGAQIHTIREIAEWGAEKYPPLHLGLEGIGFFPHAHKPRVIWVGVSGDVEALTRLQSELEKKLGEAGFAMEDRGFRAHATIGRVKDQGGRLGNQDKNRTDSDIKTLPVIKTEPRQINKIVLFQSLLNPEGPRYEILETFHLSSKPGS